MSAIPVSSPPSMGGYYVLVENKEEKKATPAPLLSRPTLSRALSGAVSATLRGRRPVRAVLPFALAASSSAATAYTGVQACSPGTATEYASFAALYDEVRCHGGRLTGQISTTDKVLSARLGVVAYDPMDGGTLASVVAGVEQKQHKLLLLDAIGSSVVAPGTMHVAPFTFEWKSISGVAVDPSNPDRVGGSTWVATTSSAGKWGFVKFFLPAQATEFSLINLIFELDVEFRSRG